MHKPGFDGLQSKHIIGFALTLSLLSLSSLLAASAEPQAVNSKVTPLPGKSHGVTPLKPVDTAQSSDVAVSSATADSQEQAVQTETQEQIEAQADQAPGAPPAAVEASEPAVENEQNAFAILQNKAAEHYDAAHVYITNWDFEMAEQELKASIMCVPKTMAAHRDYCFVALFRGNLGRSVAEFLQVVGLCEPVAYTEQQKNEIKDSGLKLHYRRGLALAGESKYDDALTEFEWARDYRPNAGKVTRSIAFVYASIGQFERAEKEYAQGFQVDPADAYGHADLAFLMAAKGSAERAVEQLSEAVKLQPKVAALHVDLGWMAESKGDLSKAENEFMEAVKLSPKHASLWTHLGKLQARQGKADEAKHAYEQALALDPEQMDAKEGLSHLGGGQG
ncbi:MAG: tetratricopeptide repeat protein [Candidatus Obscuribacter sp.]|nr:tetratricopeptide repeat protein [Candidatus Obscuribacter sp.]MDQ5965290.1 Tetratricopeptide repeat protein [Cyanobacteriota bacterium erpe_2018_sw_39hr_WHONDRS-SW48-000098_B_bin.30]MBK9202417.1 tetratricopeptide repeat protein [Candidatus Obscuribacter sp.]MBK9618792.1 tetratricopeptide repeat protein [Candidatus Obscuribacter sp.]MBK9769797.1 tetratricopeptide repeat protein [Candidatus Obscuribacter sp.]